MILLSTGMDEESDYALAVVNERKHLDYTARWPASFTEPKVVCGKWLVGRGVKKLEMYHPMIKSMKSSIPKLPGPDNCVRSTVRIPMPFPVRPSFETHVLDPKGDRANGA